MYIWVSTQKSWYCPPKMDGENFMVPHPMNKWDDLGVKIHIFIGTTHMYLRFACLVVGKNETYSFKWWFSHYFWNMCLEPLGFWMVGSVPWFLDVELCGSDPSSSHNDVGRWHDFFGVLEVGNSLKQGKNRVNLVVIWSNFYIITRDFFPDWRNFTN